MKINNKKAAMEMSVGTIVTIVLLMTVLILGLVLTRTIFKSSVENINSIDQAVKNEINKLFSEDSTRKVIVYPAARAITIKKGTSGGFGFAIRNTDTTNGTFSYTVESTGSNTCNMPKETADKLIIFGSSGDTGEIGSGDANVENAVLVTYDIPSTNPLCKIRYVLNVKKDGVTYLPGGISIDLTIAPA